MPSLLKQDHRYYSQFYDSDRKPNRKKVPLKTSRKRSAKQAHRRLVDAWATGEFDPWRDNPQTFREQGVQAPSLSVASSQFLDAKETEGLSSRTLNSYRGRLSGFSSEVGDKTVDTIGPEDIEAYCKDQNVSTSTRHTRFRVLRSFFGWLEENGAISERPTESVTPPNRPQDFPRPVSEDELEQICEAVRSDYEQKKEMNGVRQGDIIWRERAFRWSYLTGMRLEEIARLRWTHIDDAKGLILIPENKSGRPQTVPLIQRAVKVLGDAKKDHKKTEAEYFVFRSPRANPTERNIGSWKRHHTTKFTHYRKKAGLSDEITHHSLRHGTASRLAEAGKTATTIKEFLRHSSIDTSMKYVRMSNEQLRNEVDSVFS
jgi:integrase/recombinase XerD